MIALWSVWMHACSEAVTPRTAPTHQAVSQRASAMYVNVSSRESLAVDERRLDACRWSAIETGALQLRHDGLGLGFELVAIGHGRLQLAANAQHGPEEKG